MPFTFPKLSLNVAFLTTLLLPLFSLAQEKNHSFLYGDALPDAPALSARGEYQVGVQTLQFVNKGQVEKYIQQSRF